MTSTRLENKSLRIGVFGAPGSGKTTFIQSICSAQNADGAIYEYQNHDQPTSQTPLALDFAKLQDDDCTLYLFKNRYECAETQFSTSELDLVKSLDGFIFFVGGVKNISGSVIDANRWIHQVLFLQKDIPYIVAANFQDLPKAFSPDEIHHILRLDQGAVALPCVAHNRGSASFILWSLLSMLQDSPERALAVQKLRRFIPDPTSKQVPWNQIKNVDYLQEEGLRIGVFGAFSSGKTLFIESVCQLAHSDERTYYWDGKKTSPSKSQKSNPSLDLGLIHEAGFTLQLFGNPSASRFDMRWFTEPPYLVENLAGMVIMVDCVRHFPVTMSENAKILEQLVPNNIPYVIAANCQDLPHAQSPETIRKIFNIGDSIKILPCVAHDLGSVSFVLWNLLQLLPVSPERDVFAEKIKKNIPIPTLQWAGI